MNNLICVDGFHYDIDACRWASETDCFAKDIQCQLTHCDHGTWMTLCKMAGSPGSDKFGTRLVDFQELVYKMFNLSKS